MNTKSKILFGISYLIILIGAFIGTSWYTSDLEMLWLAAFMIVPVWAVVFGFVVSIITKFLTSSDMKTAIWVVVFSLIVHVGLMIEETSVSVIKHTFDNYAKVLNDEERARLIHEVKLGEGKSLYFTNNKDENLQLNFEFEGGRTIARNRIVALAKQWLYFKGYGVAEINELQTYTKSFRKRISFELENPGEVLLTFSLENGPKKPQGKLKQIILGLKFNNGSFAFEERGWTYD